MPDSPQKGPDLAPGQKLGNYTIVRQIGEGGMGAVYEANQAGINRRVALKVLPKALMQNQVFLERFLREAQSAGALNHPNIVTVYEVVQDKGHYFFSMEYVDGYTLREHLKRTGRMSADEALKIVRKVAQALHYAWTEARIIHRDIKPDNIMLTRQGEVKVADLGLAKSTARDTTVTADGTGIGTPAYMSPEQSRGSKDIDCRADIYSLGITLFQMLTGQLPFEGETPYAVVMAHAEQPLPDPKSICPDIPDSVSALIQRMCAKDPSHRYESPGQLVDEIDALAQPGAAGPTQPVQTEAFRQQPTIPISQRRRRAQRTRSRTPAILAAVFGLAAIGGLGYLMFGKGGPGGSTTTTTSTTPTTVKGVVVVSPDQAREMFEYATEYAQKHPDQFTKIIDMFEEVRIECKGTVYAMKATVQIDEWREKWDQAGDVEIAERKTLVARHLTAAEFAKARGVWNDFPKNLLTDATREKVNAEIAKVEAAVRAFAQNLKRQAAPYLAKRPGQLTAADITALTALKTKAERPPAGLDAAGKAALAALAGQIGQALAAHQEHRAALRAEALEDLWKAYEPQMKGKGFDRAGVLVKGAEGKIDAEVSALLTKDTPLVADLFAKVKKNLPHLKGKTIRIGGMAMTVADVKDDKVIVRQDTAEMAFGMDKLGRETVLMLALMGEKDPGLIVRKKALFAFYYGRATEVVAKLKEAADAGADVAFYLSRLRPVLVVTSVPPGSSVAVEVKKDGAWQKVAADAQKTPARCEVPGHGSYRVKVSRKGYLTGTREVSVREAGELKLVFSLKKAGAWPPFRDGLVLHYSFDEAGDRAEDLSGNGNHGTVHGGTWTAKGKVGGAGKFDGRNAYVETPHSKSFDFEPNEFTIALWICPTAWTGRTGMNAIVSKGLSDRGNWLMRVAKRHETGNVAKLNSETAVGRRFANREVGLSRWHHVAVRKDRRSLSFYLDGKQDGVYDHGPALDTTGPLRICGQWPDQHDWGVRERFNGLVDEFMVFNRALSEAEIRALAEPQKVIGEEPPAVARYDVEALLAAGFEIPKEAKDKYGNPIRKGTDATTDLPLEIRHKKTGMHLVFIPAGEFMMGSPEDEEGRHPEREGPAHRVEIRRSFYLGKCEVTQAEWQAVLGDNPSKFRDDRNPVHQVTWNRSQEFIKGLNSQFPTPNPKLRYSLPSEAQWEYACRAGTETRFHYGDDPGYRKLGDYAWYEANSGNKPHRVGQKKPNAWGLYDMMGNAREWCEDRWHRTYRGAPSHEGAWIADGDHRRSLRGFMYANPPDRMRSACRVSHDPSNVAEDYGLRVALAIPTAGGQGPPIRNGLVLYYPFDKAGDRAEDLSGAGNHGTVRGAKWTTDGKVGGAYEFDGRDDSIRTICSKSLDLSESLSLAAWVRFRGEGTGNHQIILRRNPVDYQYAIGRYSKEARYARPNHFYGGLHLGRWKDLISDYFVHNGTWHHFAMTYDRQHARLYVDGRLNKAIPATLAATGGKGDLFIGMNPLGAGEYTNATIDEAMVFNRALSAVEVRLLASPERWGAAQRPPGAMPPGQEAAGTLLPVRRGWGPHRRQERQGKPWKGPRRHVVGKGKGQWCVSI